MESKKTKEILLDIGSGAAMGVAAAIPGVSGGTVAVMTKVYDRHLDHMNGLRSKKIWSNLLALLPLLCGIICGVIPAVILFNMAFKGFMFGIVSLFAGFIIGGMPALFDEIKGKKIKPIYIVIGLITAVIALLFGVLSVQFGDAIDISGNFNIVNGMYDVNGSVSWWIYLALIPVGMIAAIALIVPGISGSMILLVTGFYTPLLNTVDWWKEILKGNGTGAMVGSAIGIYLCLLVGILIGFFTIVKLMKFLLDKFRVESFYGIIGFVVGSFVSLFYNNEIYSYYQHWINPTEEFSNWMSMGAELGVAAVLLIVGIALSYLLVRYSRKHTTQPSEIESTTSEE